MNRFGGMSTSTIVGVEAVLAEGKLFNQNCKENLLASFLTETYSKTIAS